MDNAGQEAAYRWHAVRKWAGLLGLSLLTLTLSFWLTWRAAEEYNAALRTALYMAHEIEVTQRQALEATQWQAEAWEEVAQREAIAQRTAGFAAEIRRSAARALELTVAGRGRRSEPGRKLRARVGAELSRASSQAAHAATQLETAAQEELKAARRKAELREAVARREIEVWRETALKHAETRSLDPRNDRGETLPSILTVIAVSGALVSCTFIVLNALVGWRAERRRAQEVQFKTQQLNIRCRS